MHGSLGFIKFDVDHKNLWNSFWGKLSEKFAVMISLENAGVKRYNMRSFEPHENQKFEVI